jgi:exodeoxyribonuclease VII small subunit
MTDHVDPTAAGGDDDPGIDDIEDVAGLSYADAIDELEALLGDLERDDADIDELAAKVKRAAALIRLCRARVDDARVDVERIVADLDAGPID